MKPEESKEQLGLNGGMQEPKEIQEKCHWTQKTRNEDEMSPSC